MVKMDNGEGIIREERIVLEGKKEGKLQSTYETLTKTHYNNKLFLETASKRL